MNGRTTGEWRPWQRCAVGLVLLATAAGCRLSPQPLPGTSWQVAPRSAPPHENTVKPAGVSVPTQPHVRPAAAARALKARAGVGRVAVLRAPSDGGQAAIAFVRSFRGLLRLRPDAVVILGSVSVSSSGRFRVGSALLSVGPGTAGTCPVLIFPGPNAGQPQHPWRRDFPGGALLFLPARATGEVEGDGVNRAAWVARELHALPKGAGAILFLGGSSAGSFDDSGSRVARAIHDAHVPCPVFYPGALRTSWSPGLDSDTGVFRVAFPGGNSTADMEQVRDGLANGFFWTVLGKGANAVTFVPTGALFPPEALFAGDQEKRSAIRAAVTASPASDLEPVTVVECTNPTDQALTFHAAWHFDVDGFRVDPEVLEFTIEPRGRFRQRFRFLYDRDLALKFARPVFVMSTFYRNRDGIEVPIRVEAAPHCILTGTVSWAEHPPVIDGDGREWVQGGALINHSAQLVEGAESWKGPGDLSASLFAARDQTMLYLSVIVHDDQPGTDGQPSGRSEYVDFFLAAASGPRNPKEKAPEPPLWVRIQADGQWRVRRGAASGAASRIQAAARRNNGGYCVEAALPLDLISGQTREAKSIRLDAAVHEQDTDDPRPVALFFSGNETDETSPALLGVFEFAKKPPPSTP